MDDQKQCDTEPHIGGLQHGLFEPSTEDLEQGRVARPPVETPKNDHVIVVVELPKGEEQGRVDLARNIPEQCQVDSPAENLQETQAQPSAGVPEQREAEKPLEVPEQGRNLVSGEGTAPTRNQGRVRGPRRSGMAIRFVSAVARLAFKHATFTTRSASIFALVPPLLELLKVEGRISAIAIEAYLASLAVVGLVSAWLSLFRKANEPEVGAGSSTGSVSSSVP